MTSLREINPRVKNMRPLDCSVLVRRASQIKEMLKQGESKPYKDVIDVHCGDPHRAGVKPLSFVRQVIAACIYPELMNGNKLPADVRERAQKLLGGLAGGGVGSYPGQAGSPKTARTISEFITRRDGGAPSCPENIFISSGSLWSLSNIITLLVDCEGSARAGVLTPVPCPSAAILSMTGLGAVTVPYYLSEEQGWELQVDELHRALESAKGVCNPVALYVINPGSPTGHVQSRKSMQEVIRFASEKRLVLLADEVYQECVYGENTEFLSYKRILAEMRPPLSESLELASFHSASKGLLGECGLRGGYVELVNLDPAVVKYVQKLFAKDSDPPVTGNIALDLSADPPQPGDPSYPLYHELITAAAWVLKHLPQETQHIRTTTLHNMKRATQVLDGLPGFSCRPVDAGAFVFPRLHLPPKAVQKAKEEGEQPDMFYCVRLLEEAGVLVSPGFVYGQKEGTYHIGFNIMTPEATMEELLRRLTSFHTQFMKDFS